MPKKKTEKTEQTQPTPVLFSFVRETKEENPTLKLNGSAVDVLLSLMMLYELLPIEMKEEWTKIPSKLEIADTMTSFQLGQHKPSETLIFNKKQ
jgi:hypothetical protein